MTQRQVFQFKITLQGSKPLIWRRIQISDLCNFWNLHLAIQDAMGWENYHLFEFEVTNNQTKKKECIGLPEEGYPSDILFCEDFKVRDYILNSKANQKIKYLYDFGDDWEHIIEFEGTHDKIKGKEYPICIAGGRACPPEDVGGIHSYIRYLKVLSNPKHEEYEEILEWMGEDFDPNKFELEAV